MCKYSEVETSAALVEWHVAPRHLNKIHRFCPGLYLFVRNAICLWIFASGIHQTLLIIWAWAVEPGMSPVLSWRHVTWGVRRNHALVPLETSFLHAQNFVQALYEPLVKCKNLKITCRNFFTRYTVLLTFLALGKLNLISGVLNWAPCYLHKVTLIEILSNILYFVCSAVFCVDLFK